MPDTTIIVSGLALAASALSAAITGWFALRGKREDAIGKHALSALMDQAEFREDLMKQLARCQTHTSRLEADIHRLSEEHQQCHQRIAALEAKIQALEARP